MVTTSCHELFCFHAPPDGILGSLSDQCSDSPDGQAPTGLIGGTDQLTRNGHGIS